MSHGHKNRYSVPIEYAQLKLEVLLFADRAKAWKGPCITPGRWAINEPERELSPACIIYLSLVPGSFSPIAKKLKGMYKI